MDNTSFSDDKLPTRPAFEQLRYASPDIAAFCQQHGFSCRYIPRGYQFSKSGVHLCWWPRGDTLRIQGRMNTRYRPSLQSETPPVLQALQFIQRELDHEQKRLNQ